jgi:hypothetical protein
VCISFSALVRYDALDVHYRRADVCSTTLGESLSQMSSSSTAPVLSNQALSFDSTGGIPAWLIKRILEFESVEMADMLPDTWQEDSQMGTDTHPLLP